MTRLKVTNTFTGRIFEAENTNHAWGDLAQDSNADLIWGDTECLLNGVSGTWYLLDECCNWDYLPAHYAVEVVKP